MIPSRGRGTACNCVEEASTDLCTCARWRRTSHQEGSGIRTCRRKARRRTRPMIPSVARHAGSRTTRRAQSARGRGHFFARARLSLRDVRTPCHPPDRFARLRRAASRTAGAWDGSWASDRQDGSDRTHLSALAFRTTRFCECDGKMPIPVRLRVSATCMTPLAFVHLRTSGKWCQLFSTPVRLRPRRWVGGVCHE